jgi:UDPglucose 6-dehydrogenase
MDPASAEMTKYAANVMLATRISFMNELAELCEEVGADVEQVRQGVGCDSRIGQAFLFPGIGFGGSCFPKDVRALIYSGSQHHTEMGVARAVEKANARARERFSRRVIDYFSKERGKVTLAVWGLAFKAKTDDIRDSPAMYCVEELLKAGIGVRAYDPEAASAAITALKGKIKVFQNGYETLDGADGLIVLTDWQEFRNPDFETIAERLTKPVIFDGRNLYDPALVRAAGLQYHSVGR